MTWDKANEAKRRYRRPPTLKQIKALQYMNQGMSKRQALIKAGYSESVYSHPQKAFMQKKGVRQIIDTMVGELNDAGLTTAYMVNKFKEWMESQQSVVTKGGQVIEIGPDHQLQLAAYREWKKIIDQEKGDNPNGKVKRKMTIEEFVTGEEQEVINGNA